VAILVAVIAPLAALGAFSDAPGVAIGQSWTSAGRSETAEGLEHARSTRFPRLKRVSYAVLGRNNERGHAAFLYGAWDLACPRFHQYPFSLRLDEVVRCIAEHRPALVLVTYPLPGGGHPRTRWDEFLDEVATLLARNYERVPAPGETVEVWALRQ
jgi:hypothetical protein